MCACCARIVYLVLRALLLFLLRLECLCANPALKARSCTARACDRSRASRVLHPQLVCGCVDCSTPRRKHQGLWRQAEQHEFDVMHDEPWGHSNPMKLSSQGITGRRTNPMKLHHYAMRQLRVQPCSASVIRPQSAVDVPAFVD